MFGKRIIVCLIPVVILLTTVQQTHAQCAMCKAVAESNMKKNKASVGKGLNQGIIYLLSIPYIIGLSAGVLWLVRRKQLGAYFKKF